MEGIIKELFKLVNLAISGHWLKNLMKKASVDTLVFMPHSTWEAATF